MITKAIPGFTLSVDSAAEKQNAVCGSFQNLLLLSKKNSNFVKKKKILDNIFGNYGKLFYLKVKKKTKLKTSEMI